MFRKSNSFIKKLSAFLTVCLMITAVFPTVASAGVSSVSMGSISNIASDSMDVSATINTHQVGDVINSWGFEVYKDNVRVATATVGTDSSWNYTSYTISARLSGLTDNTTYQIRAFAFGSTDSATLYSSFSNVTTANIVGAPVITESTATLINNKIIGAAKISDTSYVYERGFVYSTSSKIPTTSDSKVAATTSSADYSVSFDVDADKDVYYVRAYASSNVNGKEYTGYGSPITINIASTKPTVKTGDILNITKDSAQVYIDVTKGGTDTITERGILYSKTEKTPVLNNNTTTNSNTLKSTIFGTFGSASATLVNLEYETLYYVRAYATNSSGTSYGEVKTFTTEKGVKEANLLVNYQTADGTTVGTQTLSTKTETILTAKDLTIPANYTLSNANWTYTVTQVAAVTNVLVISNKPKESEFMPGTSNYKFEPDVAATRAEVAQILYNLSSDKTYTISKTYPDVPNNYATLTSSKAAIDFVTAKNYMGGYANGNFGPNDPLTRAQVATVLCNFYKLSGTLPATFPDTLGHWAQNYVSLAANAGMIGGYPGGLFGPDDAATRAQVCQLFSNAEKRSLNPLGTTNFTDVPQGHWAYKAIMNASVPRP